MLIFAVALNILLGLWLESSGFSWALLFVNLVTWTHFAFYFWRGSSRLRVEMSLCLVLATCGELFLSEVWGVYSYREGTLPLFVPPGHVLLYLAGVAIANWLGKYRPDETGFSRFLGPMQGTWGDLCVKVLPLAFLVLNLSLWTRGLDTNGLIWFSVFLLCLWKGRDRVLYVTMFLLALGMEIYGTGLGSWVWREEVPWLGLTSLNPPVCAGVLYCLLDMLVIKGAKLGQRSKRLGQEPGAPSLPHFQTGQKKTS